MSQSAAYFDVDGTLVGTNLIHPTVLHMLNQETMWRSATRVGRALLRAPAMAMAEMRDRRLFNEMLFSNYQGMTEDRIVVLAEECWERVVLPRMFSGTRDLIDKCKAANQRVVLVTGSLACIVQHLAADLGADAFIANRLEYKDGCATGKLLRPVVAGPEKSGLIVRDAREHGHDLSTCSAYSDSYSDVPMLSIVGHPACINPDKRLQRLAKAYDWPVLDIRTPPRGSHL